MYKKRNLLRGAIPTLKLPKEIEHKGAMTIATEILNDWDDTPPEDFFQACDKYLHLSALFIVKVSGILIALNINYLNNDNILV